MTPDKHQEEYLSRGMWRCILLGAWRYCVKSNNPTTQILKPTINLPVSLVDLTVRSLVWTTMRGNGHDIERPRVHVVIARPTSICCAKPVQSVNCGSFGRFSHGTISSRVSCQMGYPRMHLVNTPLLEYSVPGR